MPPNHLAQSKQGRDPAHIEAKSGSSQTPWAGSSWESMGGMSRLLSHTPSLSGKGHLPSLVLHGTGGQPTGQGTGSSMEDMACLPWQLAATAHCQEIDLTEILAWPHGQEWQAQRN